MVLLVVAFFAVTNFFFRGNVELTFPFLPVVLLSLHAVYYAKNETSDIDHVNSVPGPCCQLPPENIALVVSPSQSLKASNFNPQNDG